MDLGSLVGLFVGFIGLKTGGIIIQNEATFLSLGNFKNIETLLAGIGFLLILILAIRKIAGAIIIPLVRKIKLICFLRNPIACKIPIAFVLSKTIIVNAEIIFTTATNEIIPKIIIIGNF